MIEEFECVVLGGESVPSDLSRQIEAAGTTLQPGDVLKASREGDAEWQWQILRAGRAEAHGEAEV